ncbi:hypothetical protein LMG28614_03280 [Paraburkholderia ultramafica]|uniref:Uncharacterized protein n=2 Tax=Paraburkholderia ultramafica TaxID=1544867 RepID=A0A6S7BK74_9BURK|nr:hypothetical protein LMG28614_03280 [Paraburkholderia ultramafica]
MLQLIIARVESRAALLILHPSATDFFIYAGLLIEQQLTFQIGPSNTEVIHEIVQYALRSAAVAFTANGAIDVPGQALLEVERLVAHTSVLTHGAICPPANWPLIRPAAHGTAYRRPRVQRESIFVNQY